MLNMITKDSFGRKKKVFSKWCDFVSFSEQKTSPKGYVLGKGIRVLGMGLEYLETGLEYWE